MKSLLQILAFVLTAFCLFSVSNPGLGQRAVQPAVAESRGAPTSAQARLALQNRIEQQAEGRIKLLSFRQTSMSAMELNGARAWTISFEVQIEFAEACKWASRFENRPMTFKTFNMNEDDTKSRGDGVFAVLQKGETFKLQGYEILTLVEQEWKPAGFGSSANPKRAGDEVSENCVTQLKQIGLAFRIWAGDNNDRFPFNVSSSAGGTKELCALGPDGFDKHGAMHFQVMSNELNSTKILVCPADPSKKASASFQVLSPSNVSYQVRSGINIDDSHAEEVLAICPVHGHVLRADGSVTPETKK